jgi:nicotinamidase/pyrazinamidase
MATALLVIDMQHDFMAGGAMPVPGADETFQDEVRYAARRFEGPVFFTKHINMKPDATYCAPGALGAQIVLPTLGRYEIIKYRYSAFTSKTLERDLRLARVERLRVVGVATDYCVLATVLDALELGFHVTVDETLCRGFDPAGTISALTVMFKRGASVVR